MLFYHKRLKKAENIAKNSHFKYKKGLIRYLLCIKPILFLCLETQYLIQFRTPKVKRKAIQLSDGHFCSTTSLFLSTMKNGSAQSAPGYDLCCL